MAFQSNSYLIMALSIFQRNSRHSCKVTLWDTSEVNQSPFIHRRKVCPNLQTNNESWWQGRKDYLSLFSKYPANLPFYPSCNHQCCTLYFVSKSTSSHPFRLALSWLWMQVCENQAKHVAHHDQHSESGDFHVRQYIMVKNLHLRPNWTPGVTVECLGPDSFTVEVYQGIHWNSILTTFVNKVIPL